MTSLNMGQMETWWHTGQQGWQRIVGSWQRFQRFWHRFQQLWQRGSGFLLLGGGVAATVGWLTASLNQNPLSGAWTGAVWTVIVGAILILMGMMGLYAQHALRAGMVGMYGLLFLFGGTLLLIVGAGVVDLIILPKLFQAVSQVPNLTAQLQGVLNTSAQGVNSATNTVTNGGSNACNAVANFFGAGNCSSTPPPSSPVPTVTLPQLNGPTLVNGLLGVMGLPTLAAIGGLGLSLLSGAFLAPGCLVLAAALLWAGFRPRWPMLGLMATAVLSLLSQFGLKVPVVGHSGGVLFFLAVAVFGALLSFPGRWHLALPEHLLTFQVAGLAREAEALGQAAYQAVRQRASAHPSAAEASPEPAPETRAEEPPSKALPPGA
jgi:hypothetical protein